MTHNYKNYKIGDKVLVEVFIKNAHYDGGFYVSHTEDRPMWIEDSKIRPYTPRQEFEYGEEVEVRSYEDHKWVKRIYVGTIQGKRLPYITIARAYDDEHFIHDAQLNISSGNFETHSWKYIRKLQPRETITIAGITYDKAEFENAVKDLKPVEGK